MTGQRVWRINQLKPHLLADIQDQQRPRFAEKIVDVVGLYMNPPEHALVLFKGRYT